MAEEEKKEIESSEEDEKELDSEEQEQEQKSEEEESSKKDEFEKDNEFVPSSKYNQALRKARELEARERELKKQLEQKTVVKDDEESEGEKFFKDIDEDEEEAIKSQPDTSKILDEKLKPVLDRLNQRDESDRKISRAAFFDAHPEYEKSAEKWQELLDILDNDINPKSKDDHYTQLEKAHRIRTGETYDAELEGKKIEIASDAASSGDGAVKGSIKEEFTTEDKKYMKDFNVSEEGMRAYKRKIESGDMVILT